MDTDDRDLPDVKRPGPSAALGSPPASTLSQNHDNSSLTGDGADERTIPPAKRQKNDSGESSTLLATLSNDKEGASSEQTIGDGQRTPRKGQSQYSYGTGSSTSDLSSSTSGLGDHTHHDEILSPISTEMQKEVPPAPPSTPASQASVFSWDASSGTPFPIHPDVANAARLQEEQAFDGAATPAPPRPESTSDSSSKPPVVSDDFSDWAVGDRYRMMRILGRGSYGEVAQALDLFAGREDAFVAIKRIQSPFDQEVDAIRLYREMYILRRMRGHHCIIQLLDIVQPPTDDLDDFHDLYLVFECKTLLLQRN